MLGNIVRDMLGQQQRRLDDWLADQAAALGLSVEDLAARYTLEAGPVELGHGETPGTFRAVQNYRLKPREEGPQA